MLDPEIRVLAARCAVLPRGLALLHRGPIEYVAAALRATPALVERARAALEVPGEREVLVQDYVVARRAPPAAGPSTEEAPAPRDARGLADAAAGHAFELAFLMDSSIETAAIAFGVHPDVVAQAREIVAARGGSELA
jgi:hypothetical protein